MKKRGGKKLLSSPHVIFKDAQLKVVQSKSFSKGVQLWHVTLYILVITLLILHVISAVFFRRFAALCQGKHSTESTSVQRNSKLPHLSQEQLSILLLPLVGKISVRRKRISDYFTLHRKSCLPLKPNYCLLSSLIFHCLQLIGLYLFYYSQLLFLPHFLLTVTYLSIISQSELSHRFVYKEVQYWVVTFFFIYSLNWTMTRE